MTFFFQSSPTLAHTSDLHQPPKTLQNHTSITPLHSTLRSLQHMPIHHVLPNYRLNADNILANAVICAFCTTFLTPSVLSPSSFPCPVRSEVLVDISLRYMGDVDFCASLAGRSRSEMVSNFGSFGFLGGRGFRLGGEPPTRGN